MYKIYFKDNNIGEIILGNFEEDFHSDFSYWDKNKYETQWQEALSMIENGVTTAFVTLIGHPHNMNFMRWWLCYPIGREVVFQEHIVFMDEIRDFDEEKIYSYIPQYENVTDEGKKISEWRVPFQITT